MKNDQMYLHPEVETLSRPDIEKLQLKRLKATIDRCMHSPFYKNAFSNAASNRKIYSHWRIYRKFLSLPNRICATIIRSGFLPCLWNSEIARLHSSQWYHRNSYRDSAHTARFGRMGQCRSTLSVYGGGCVKEIFSKILPATVCLPEDWASSMVPNVWVC